jgi:hypothetical protein
MNTQLGLVPSPSTHSTSCDTSCTAAAHMWRQWEATHACGVSGRGNVHDEKVANRNVEFGWEIAHEAVSRRPPISLSRIVARTHMCTYTANVWDLSIVQGPFSVAPCKTLRVTIRNFCIAVRRDVPRA